MNAAKCLVCGYIIFSRYPKEMSVCPCRNQTMIDDAFECDRKGNRIRSAYVRYGAINPSKMQTGVLTFKPDKVKKRKK